MTVDLARWRVPPGGSVDLADWPTAVPKTIAGSRTDARAALKRHRRAIRERQVRQYAEGRHAIVVILQGMDASGKDGVIRTVMAGVNPQGCEVHSFRHPTPHERAHDFLWRYVRRLPTRGRIALFNRSWYEDVLIARVDPAIRTALAVPDGGEAEAGFWARRLRSINDLESHLHASGTRVVKCFLHLSRETQRKRLLRRIDDPAKNWKFSEADLAARDRWDDYQRAYGTCLAETSTDHAPWHIIPADRRRDARVLVAALLAATLGDLDPQLPTADAERRHVLAAARRRLLYPSGD